MSAELVARGRCMACLLGILPGHRHKPMPPDVRELAEQQGHWPGFSVPAEWKRPEYPR